MIITITTEMIKEYGVNESIMLAYLKQLTNPGVVTDTIGQWLICTTEDAEKKTGLTSFQQRKALENLVNKDIIEVAYTGMPRKRCISFKTDVYH